MALQVAVDWPKAGGNRLEIVLDGRVACTLADPGDSRCTFDVPATARELVVRGKYVVEGRADPLEGASEVALVDASVVSAPLREAGVPLGTRWRRAVDAEIEFTEAHDLFASMGVDEPAPAADVKAAEARLGFALPAGYAEFVQDVGGASIGDHFFVAPKRITSGSATLFNEWGLADLWKLDDDLTKKVPPKMLGRINRSVALFTEVGDGLGAWLYVAPPVAGCGEQGGWQWLHQDTVGDDLAALEKGPLRCVGFDEIVRDVQRTYVFSSFDDELRELGHRLLIDMGDAATEVDVVFGSEADSGFSVDLLPR